MEKNIFRRSISRLNLKPKTYEERYNMVVESLRVIFKYAGYQTYLVERDGLTNFLLQQVKVNGGSRLLTHLKKDNQHPFVTYRNGCECYKHITFHSCESPNIKKLGCHGDHEWGPCGDYCKMHDYIYDPIIPGETRIYDRGMRVY